MDRVGFERYGISHPVMEGSLGIPTTNGTVRYIMFKNNNFTKKTFLRIYFTHLFQKDQDINTSNIVIGPIIALLYTTQI